MSTRLSLSYNLTDSWFLLQSTPLDHSEAKLRYILTAYISVHFSKRYRLLKSLHQKKKNHNNLLTSDSQSIFKCHWLFPNYFKLACSNQDPNAVHKCIQLISSVLIYSWPLNIIELCGSTFTSIFFNQMLTENILFTRCRKLQIRFFMHLQDWL